MPVRKAKTRGEWKHISPILPIAPVLAKGELMFLVSHGEEQKKILLQGRMWDEVSVCSTVCFYRLRWGIGSGELMESFQGFPSMLYVAKILFRKKS